MLDSGLMSNGHRDFVLCRYGSVPQALNRSLDVTFDSNERCVTDIYLASMNPTDQSKVFFVDNKRQSNPSDFCRCLEFEGNCCLGP